MKRVIAVIDKRDFPSYAQDNWLGYDNTYVALKEKLSFIPEIYTIASDADISLDVTSTTQDLFKALSMMISEPSIIIYIPAYAPFLDIDLLKTMLATMQKYRLEYHFAEGYPNGFSAQLIDSRILSQLQDLASKHSNIYIHRESNFIFQLLRSCINDFDIETNLAPIDLREYRINLLYNTKNNSVICDNFIKAGIVDIKSLLANIHQIATLNIGLPVYYNFQISSDCPQSCRYCPASHLAQFNKHQMADVDQFLALLPEIVAYSGEATIGLNLLGESSLHPNFIKIIQAVLEYPSLRLHIETSGIGWQEEALDFVENYTGDRLSIILSLDSLKENEYQSVRGDGFQEAMSFMHRLLRNNKSKERLWIQRMRLHDMEDQLQQFYHEAKGMTEHIIIQKYHNFANFLPSQQDIDLAPLERVGCWALQRELSIYLNGDVHLCRVDIEGKAIIGNIYTDSLDHIWQEVQKHYNDYIHKNYHHLCNHCEEYYIYTF